MRVKWIAAGLLLVAMVALIATLAVACGGDDGAGGTGAQVAITSSVPTAEVRAAAAATAGPTAVQPVFPTSPGFEKLTQATPAPRAAAAAAERPQYGGVFRQAYRTGYPPKFDLTQTSTWIALAHFGRQYSGLLQFSPRDGVEIWPDLATSWDISSDGLTYTFNIDPKVTQWNDGTPFDVNDIIFALNRWGNPPAGIIQPRVGAFKDIATMDKVDATTLDITLKSAFGDFINEAANGWHLLLPKHILEANDNTLPDADLIVGTGPFLIDQVEQGVSTTSVRNPDYWRSDPDGNAYPYLDGMISVTMPEVDSMVAAIRTKRLDSTKLFERAYLELQKVVDENPGEAFFPIVPMVDIGSIQLNNQAPPFDNFDNRKAVFLGINKRRLIDSHGDADPVGPVGYYSNLLFDIDEINNFPGFNAANRAEEEQMARDLIAKTGLKEFELISVPFRVPDAELVAQDMALLGVDVTIRSTDWTTMVAACEGRKFEAATGGTAPSYAGVIPIIDIMWAPGGGRNCGWDATMPPEWEQLWLEAKIMGPGPERVAKLREMFKIQIEEWIPSIPYLGVQQGNFFWGYVHNYANVAQDIFSNNKFEDIWLDESAPTR